MKRLLFLLPYFIMLYACKNGGEVADVSYDPSKPSVVTGFMPDSGYVRTKLVIKGDNFGNDKNKLRVEFLDSEGKSNEAVVVNSINNAIYVVVPKQAGGISNIKVYRENVLIDNSVDKGFKYIVTSSVSTVVGKAMEGSVSTDGTLGETTFQEPQHVLVDNEDNLFICDYSFKVRLVSLKQNKSITLLTSQCGESVWINKEKTKIFTPGQLGSYGCFVFDSNLAWMPDKYGQLIENSVWMTSAIIAPVDSNYVFYRQNKEGKLFTQPLVKGMNINKATFLGNVGATGDGYLVYNPVDKYVYVSIPKSNAIYRLKLKRGDDGIPTLDGEPEIYFNNGPGFADGGLEEARFNQPRGMAVDSKGYLYVADTSNNRIRRIDTQQNVVTTVAGTGEKGYEDGDPLMSKFDTPWGIAIDKNDFIYIADRYNHCIRKLSIE